MRISNSQRREAALKLRDVAQRAPLELTDGELIDSLADAIGFDRCEGDFDGGLLGRIADLVDRPTAKKLECDHHYWRCTRCGAFVNWDSVANLTNVVPANYCPNCGAEVVGE